MCVCAPTSTCTRTCAHMHTCTHAHTHTHTHTRTHTFQLAHTHMHTHSGTPHLTHTNSRTDACTLRRKGTRTHSHTLTHTHRHTHTHTHTLLKTRADLRSCWMGSVKTSRLELWWKTPTDTTEAQCCKFHQCACGASEIKYPLRIVSLALGADARAQSKHYPGLMQNPLTKGGRP